LRSLEDGRAEFTVRDEGRGFASGSTEGLGFRLMSALAEQLRGSLEKFDDGGAVVRLRFHPETLSNGPDRV
jgi:two-component sensor histidine kinase